MIDKILDINRKTDFDFRNYTNSSDELFYLFDEWVPYYKMKYAICKVLKPKTILEIGVRYGYSAITFLSAAPKAQYVGIDNDSNSFGGSTGAIHWAKEITKNYNAKFLMANTQEMEVLPGTEYDLIHIDGQQDGDGTFHDLELALPKAKWILIDGYFWSKENMLSSTYFLKKYEQFIEYAFIIPSYQGDLLVKIKDTAKDFHKLGKNYSDQVIKNEYNQPYFLLDCGGYESYKRYQGKQIHDGRHFAALNLAFPYRETSILDIGCGRGELCFALAQADARVTGIDYSSSAIKIAEKTFQNSIQKGKLEFICEDFLNYRFNQKYDRIIATDVIEHIEKNRFELILQTVADLLNERGLFIIHTSPNALNFKDPYEEKRVLARAIGSYLPKSPRTYYDDIMHINEQTPDSLKRSLEKYFPFSIVWVATGPDIVGSLDRDFSMKETMAAQSIFAVASHSPLDKARIICQLTQNPLDSSKIKAEITLRTSLEKVKPGERFTVKIVLENFSEESWVSLPPNPVHISYHWIDSDGKYVVFNGERTLIQYPLLPGEHRDFELNVVAPKTFGEYILQITLVQESCFWFENIIPSLPVVMRVRTSPDQLPLKTNKIKAKISVLSYTPIVKPEEHFTVDLTLNNLSDSTWGSFSPNPIYLSYHWLDNEGKYVVFDGERTPIKYPLLSGESRQFSLSVIAPKMLGEYDLQITLVQEACFWFENIIPKLPVSLKITIKQEERL